MKYKTALKDKSKRRHKNNLTKGAFGKIAIKTKKVFISKPPKPQTKAGKIKTEYTPYPVKGKDYSKGLTLGK